MRRLASILAAALLLSACGGGSGPGSAHGSPQGTGTAHSGKRHAARHQPAASSRVANATPQPDWKPYAGQKVPILVYHDLGNPPPGQDYPGLYVSDADFESEMAWLHSAGYEAVTLDEMMDAFFHGGRLPAKPIVITFDNGYIPQATFAPSVMGRYGWPGVLNEIIENHLSNARLERLIHMGWEVDSHSLTHPDLTTAGPAELNAEVADSRAFLRRTFHIPSNSFCYPSNRYNAAVVAAVKAAGYTNAVTENPGFATPSSDPFLLPRFEIESGLSQLQADLQG